MLTSHRKTGMCVTGVLLERYSRGPLQQTNLLALQESADTV